MRGFIKSVRSVAAAAMLACAAGGAFAQTDIPTAFNKATCSTYVSGQSWLIMGCGSSGFVQIAGLDAATNTVKDMATVTDFAILGKKPYETFSEPIFLNDTANSKVYVGSGTFNSHAAVLKVQNSCGQSGFVAGTIVNAELTTNDYVGGAVYLVPQSFHSDELSAEKAAAAISADDPGEVGDYPPGMTPNLTEPTQPTPNTFLPAKYIPGPNAPEDHAARALECYNTYRAACRTAFTTYKNTLANARMNRMNGAGAGAMVGGAAGGAVGIVVVVAACVFTGPPGWATGIGIVTVGGVIGGAGGAVAGPTIAYVEAKQAAILVLKNEMDSARAAYIKCLEGAGYMRDPLN